MKLSLEKVASDPFSRLYCKFSYLLVLSILGTSAYHVCALEIILSQSDNYLSYNFAFGKMSGLFALEKYGGQLINLTKYPNKGSIWQFTELADNKSVSFLLNL